MTTAEVRTTPSTMKRDLIMAAIVGLLGLLIVSTANAGPLTILNTSVQGSDGNSYPYIGAPYQTTGVAFTDVGGVDTLTFTTTFSGTDNVNGYNIGYASVFVGSMAISLGEGINGNVTAGLYQTGSYETSQL